MRRGGHSMVVERRRATVARHPYPRHEDARLRGELACATRSHEHGTAALRAATSSRSRIQSPLGSMLRVAATASTTYGATAVSRSTARCVVPRHSGSIHRRAGSLEGVAKEVIHRPRVQQLEQLLVCARNPAVSGDAGVAAVSGIGQDSGSAKYTRGRVAGV